MILWRGTGTRSFKPTLLRSLSLVRRRSLQLCIELNLKYAMPDSPTAVFPVRFLVQGMVLFKDSLAQWSPTRKAGTNAASMFMVSYDIVLY